MHCLYRVSTSVCSNPSAKVKKQTTCNKSISSMFKNKKINLKLLVKICLSSTTDFKKLSITNGNSGGSGDERPRSCYLQSSQFLFLSAVL